MGLSPSSPTGLLVAAPPTLLCRGLLLTLHETWPERTATLVTDPSQLLAHLRTHAYALLIVDSAAFASPLLPGLLRQARQLRANLPFLVLTGRRPPALPLGAITSLRLLPRHATPTEVAATATELLRGSPPGTAPQPSRRTPNAGFSPRELEVLALVVADLGNVQIAQRLCLSVRTVESHRRTLLHKAGVRTPVGLTARALREGWVPM
ncbi:response regulator transcription factor [Hymenobacter sp. RP-2-7]|uniref:Response regulator transcription factor n=1 Tax=Hymenobacter polaris TaxID=2682546 RepID=A0A7Y0AGB1_9BACT|nr:response regulator transcription factor [Hymenobacter polaris]NML66814.1 response regulator transcription factor [Hymenobacter polaris]